jgi:hypothetical protein
VLSRPVSLPDAFHLSTRHLHQKVRSAFQLINSHTGLFFVYSLPNFNQTEHGRCQLKPARLPPGLRFVYMIRHRGLIDWKSSGSQAGGQVFKSPSSYSLFDLGAERLFLSATARVFQFTFEFRDLSCIVTIFLACNCGSS